MDRCLKIFGRAYTATGPMTIDLFIIPACSCSQRIPIISIYTLLACVVMDWNKARLVYCMFNAFATFNFVLTICMPQEPLNLRFRDSNATTTYIRSEPTL